MGTAVVEMAMSALATPWLLILVYLHDPMVVGCESLTVGESTSQRPSAAAAATRPSPVRSRRCCSVIDCPCPWWAPYTSTRRFCPVLAPVSPQTTAALAAASVTRAPSWRPYRIRRRRYYFHKARGSVFGRPSGQHLWSEYSRLSLVLNVCHWLPVWPQRSGSRTTSHLWKVPYRLHHDASRLCQRYVSLPPGFCLD